MAEERLGRLLYRFAVAARTHWEALEAMDGEKAGHQAAVIDRLYGAIVSEGEVGRGALMRLAEGDDPAVAGMAAVYSLRYSTERCLAVLRRLAEVPGLMGFRARVAIERWESEEWELG